MKNKIVVITGASSGIGEALAKKFDAMGSNIVLAARDEVKLMAVKNSLQNKSIAVVTDVSNENDCKLLMEKAIAEFGSIDVLICNAGMSMRAMFNDVSMEVLHKLMNVNFWGAVNCCKHALPFLLQSKGSIIGVSSIAGKVGLPARTGYSASKFALEGFMNTLRIENLKNDLHVLVACPGYTASNIRNAALNEKGEQQMDTPLDENKLMTADEVATEIYMATMERKRDLVLTTNGKFTIWLNKFFPAWMDKIIYRFVAKEKDSPFK